MDQQKIDQLFREKLDSHEVTPSDQSWLEVEKKIGVSKSSNKFYWIAAAVSAILITWVVWPSNQQIETLTPIASEVNHPALNTDTPFEWAIPAIGRELKDVEPQIIRQAPVQLVAEESTKNQMKDVVEEALDVAPEQTIDLQTVVAEVDTEEMEKNTSPVIEEPTDETSETPSNDKIKIDLSKVRITYIAASAAEKEQEKDSVGAFKKFIAFAGKLSPGEMLADLKTKKDDLINGGLKSKEKDRTSL